MICNCGCTIADKQQEQQCETVATTAESNLHKLLTVAELMLHIDLRSDGPPANLPQLCWAILHQDSITYDTMHWYQVTTDPPNLHN